MELAAPRQSAPVALSFHELLCRFAPDYLERFGTAMPQRQREVLETILSCRTAALGGELYGCPDCRKFSPATICRRWFLRASNDRENNCMTAT